MASLGQAKIDIPHNSAFITSAARGFMIFAYGLFTIAAQTLVFREFITSFESNDITVGMFFACWFFWIAIGAVIVRNSEQVAGFLTAHIETLFLSYLPAFMLEVMLIIHIRRLAGIAPYVLLPIPTALLLGIAVNAPVSLITGLLFPLACRWQGLETEPAVSRVYLLESLGSFIGGLGTTLLLAFGVNSAKIFLLLAFVLSLAVFLSLFAGFRLRRGITIPVLLLAIFSGLAVVSGVDKLLARYIRTVKWSRLLPGESLSGSFQTAQAEYLYGIYQGQWVVVREGSVVGAMPDTTAAGRIIALTAAQNPGAARVLVIGSGLGLCRQFLQLPQTERLVWAHPDNEYVGRVLHFVPGEMGISDERFEPFRGDIRSTLGRQNERFDLVIVNMPAAASSVSNRYFTLEFYQQVRSSLNPGGVLALCVPAGENIMGTELVTIGASAKLTLGQVFPHFVMVPGDYAWFIVSDSNGITGDPGILRDRFAAIRGAAEVYPPNGLLSIYLPDRAAKAIDAYKTVDLPEEHLLNRDSRPLAGLYGLLLSARQSDATVTRLFKHLLVAGFAVFIAPLVVFVLLRFVFILISPVDGKQSTFDSAFLVFSTGLVGIGVVIVLMFFYQTRFGSLYLHIGAVSSLYMAGLAAGALIANRVLAVKSRLARYPETLLTGVILFHCAILALIAFWPAESWSHPVFTAAFVVCGLCAGCYFPFAAKMLAERGVETTPAASGIETADHFGAVAGGLLTSLVFVPVLGAGTTLIFFILLIAANYPAAALNIHYPGKVFGSLPLRSIGWSLFGVAASVVICSNLLTFAGRRLAPSLPVSVAQSLAGSLRIEAATAVIPNTGKSATYFKTYDANDKVAGFIFSSEDLSPQVRGFGGKINLAVFADDNGKLVDFQIIRSNETPSYLDMLANWFALLKGRDIFREQPFADVKAVTGATVSSKAILQSVAQSGSIFASGVLGQTGGQKTAGVTNRLPDWQGIYPIIAFMLTVLVIYRGGYWSRLVILVADVIVGGVVLNAQFSTEQIASLLSFNIPAVSLTGAYLLAIGAPLLALLFGNIYCGYLCPFGALQELVGLIVPVRFRPALSKELMRKGRFVKYIIAFILIVVFFLSRSHDALAYDPLISVFSFWHFDKLLWIIVAVALIGSLLYSRFWCRYLCPAGAFLSLFNKIAIFSRLLPVKYYANCDYGLSYNDKFDCIYCDKCRFEKKPAAEPLLAFVSRYFLPAVLVIAIGFSVLSVRGIVREFRTVTAVAAAPSAGQPRDVDLQQIRTMIRENKLSDHEANYYQKLE